MFPKLHYKRILKGLCGFIAIALTLPLSASAYELTDSDYTIIDTLGERIIDIIEENQSITAEVFMTRIESIIKNRNLSDRVVSILEVLVEDIEYFTSVDEDDEDYNNEYDDENNYSEYSSEESDEYTLTAEDCYASEYYDAKEQWCYPKEDSESEYGLDDNQDWEDEGDHSFHEEHSHDEDQEQAGTEFEASYDIQSDDTLKLAYGKENMQHEEVWKLFTSLVVPSYRKELLKINFFRDTENETFAYVEQIRDDENNWHMAINLAMFYPNGTLDTKESIHTLIHEYSHVLTLNKGQVTYTPLKVVDITKYQSACMTIYVQEGCLKGTSYLKAFINAFWSDTEREKANNGDVVTYSEDSFVSEYAATNPGEDIAESFTAFVLNAKPTGSTIAEKKTLFFYNYPELVKIRDLIRGRLPN